MSQQFPIPYNFIPRDYQRELFAAMDGGKKRAWLRWHRRAGKDKACWAYMVKEAVRVPGNYYYIFPTAAMAKKALWNNVDRDGFKTLHHLPPEQITGSQNKIVESTNSTMMSVNLTNGSVIQLVGLKEEDNLRGIAAKGIVFSEFAFQQPEGYKVLMPVLRESGGWAIFNSTPDGKNHFFDFEQRLLAQKAQGKAKEWYISELQTFWPDRPNYSGLISPEELEIVQADEGYTDEQMQQEYGVSYDIKAKGSIYGDLIEKARKNGRVGNFAYDETLPVYTYWDLGKSDYTCIWFAQKLGNKIIWIDYEEDNGKNVDHYAYMLRNKGYKFRGHFLPHDGKHETAVADLSYQRKLEKYLTQAGVDGEVYVADKVSVRIGIDAVRARFSRYYFDDSCDEALKKLALYHYKFDKARQVFLKEPVHDFTSHCADSIRTEAITEDIHDSFIDDYDEEVKILMDFDPFE